MKTIKTFLLSFLLMVSGNNLYLIHGQSFASVKVKEEFDAYNLSVVNRYNPCVINSTIRAMEFGEGMAYTLDGYITMYKTTRDKAYLYKFILQSLCLIHNRHDFNPNINDNEPRWDTNKFMYRDGNIIGAMAHFVYFVRNEDPSLFYETLYPFLELSNNIWNQNFTTFGQYADWLGFRIIETLDWFINHNFWDTDGFRRKSEDFPAEINQQVGMTRALLFMGLSFSNSSYLNKAMTIMLFCKSTISFYDACHVKNYNNPVFILNNSANAYWWYHSGWRVVKECSNTTKSYEKYTQFLEDLSHGALTLFLPLDYYDYFPATLFTTVDMIRFRNTFTRLIYNGDGTFNNAVIGSNFDSALDSLKRYYEPEFNIKFERGFYSGKGYFVEKEKLNVDFFEDDRAFFRVYFIDSAETYRWLNMFADILDEKGNYYIHTTGLKD